MFEGLELLLRGPPPLPRPRPRRRSDRYVDRELPPPLLERGALEDEEPSLVPVDVELEEPPD